jgi:cell division protein FtsQ
MFDKRRYNGRRIFANILWSLLGLATVVLLGAAMSLKQNKLCKGVNINIRGAQSNFFIDKAEINSILEKLSGGTLTGKTLSAFNLAAVENTLKKNQWIKNAELFFDNNELLRVDVTERDPVARIFTNTGSSFYLDTTLTALPLSDKSSARVPVFSNFPAQKDGLTKADSILLTEVKNISNYILKDPFWMAQIDQIDITPERTFEMIPKVGNQIIVFGKADNYEEKFKNLLIFYKQVATKVGWNTYSKINVQYKGQVVAVRRGTEDIVQDLLRTKQIMESIVANAQRQAGDSIKNIQLDQQQEDNIIPVAPQLDDIPDEQPLTVTLKPVVTMPVTTNPSSTEKPVATFEKTLPEKVPVTEKAVVPAKKFSKSTEKPFWLQAATAKPKSSNVLKRSTTKSRSKSNEKPNPSPPKKAVVFKSSATKAINKPIIKQTTKPIIKPKIKPKAVMPPNNDY